MRCISSSSGVRTGRRQRSSWRRHGAAAKRGSGEGSGGCGCAAAPVACSSGSWRGARSHSHSLRTNQANQSVVRSNAPRPRKNQMLTLVPAAALAALAAATASPPKLRAATPGVACMMGSWQRAQTCTPLACRFMAARLAHGAPCMGPLPHQPRTKRCPNSQGQRLHPCETGKAGQEAGVTSCMAWGLQWHASSTGIVRAWSPIPHPARPGSCEAWRTGSGSGSHQRAAAAGLNPLIRQRL